MGQRAGETYYELIGNVGAAMSLGYGGQKASARKALADADDRFSGATLSNTQQSWLAYLHGEVLLDDDPPTAIAAFTRAIELADAAGSHYVGGVARVSAITLQSRHAPAHVALPLYADVIERYVEAGSWSHLLTTMRNLVPTLTERRCVHRGGTDPGLGDPARPNPHLRRGVRTTCRGRDGAGRRAGRRRLRAATRGGQRPRPGHLGPRGGRGDPRTCSAHCNR